MFPLLRAGRPPRRWFLGPFPLLVAMAALLLACAAQKEDRSADVRAQFEEKYEAWLEYCRQPEVWSRSRGGEAFVQNQPFREIIRMGIPILPVLIEKVETTPIQGRLLHFALTDITKKKFHVRQEEIDGQLLWVADEFPDIPPGRSHPDFNILWSRWWREQLHRTPEQFEDLYEKWKQPERPEITEENYTRLVDLGIAALPLMVEKVATGEAGLIPAVSELTGQAIPPDAQPAQCLAWWKKEGDMWSIPLPEQMTEIAPKKIITDKNPQENP
ncbi:hypothetical protein ACFL0G_03240 [Candidatus Zixiibacteriota bacterium]